MVNKDKRTELELYVDKEKLDVIDITESWAKKSIEDSELKLDGYIMFRKDRKINSWRKRTWGGVLLYIKDNLMAFERTDLKDDRFKESVWREIKNKNEKMVIGLCYCPPDSSKENDIGLHELINRVTTGACIMGDFNFHIDWNKKQGKKPSEDLFLECMDENFLTQHVVEPTREENILDLVVSTKKNMIEDVQEEERFGSSDHQIIKFTIASEHEIEEIKHKKRFNYYRADFDKVRNKIKEKNLKQRLADLGVQDKWKKFASCMKEVVEETVPTYKRITKKCPWVNKDVIKTRRAKYKAWKKMQTNIKSDPNIFGTNAGRHTEETRIKYVEKRNLANKSKRKAIKDYETKLSQNIKRDSKSFYNYIKSKQK